MTQLSSALKGEVTPEMEYVAEKEGISSERLRREVAMGRAVIPSNAGGKVAPIGIGRGLRVKVNANVGTSPEHVSVEEEVRKAEVALKYGADTIMDLSISGDLKSTRKKLLDMAAPLGTVPIYEVAVAAEGEGKPMTSLDSDLWFKVIEEQAREGVDFMTVHAGLTQESLKRLHGQRLTGIVSRGGAVIASWMRHTGEENPFFAEYDLLLELAGEHDMTLSLGDALRPGSIHDASDRAQIQELVIIGELVERAREAGVQVIVEGPGHVPLDQIASNVILQKRLCKGAPFYVLGPVVTDIAPGYDHISGAIGGAIAAQAGADFLCYVTPAEHLALPDVQDVREGVVASRIAAHAADLARGRGMERDSEMSKARFNLDWERQFQLCLDPEKAREYRAGGGLEGEKEACSMCGRFCAMRLSSSFL